MATIPDSVVREAAIELLDDEHGVSSDAYTALFPLLEASGNTDICDAVKATNGRFYLTEEARGELES